ncbi:transketolase [Bradyrhizobium sp. U87765 SZCCT0131]|uniref:transketolase n=1 Tax=unclassified Bradyrhizobium TaxID=2631580 RepID=UPI001BAB4C8A|nr:MULTISPECIES: transketolase [unclassified Bradyrhizobium]MBR1216915.1 transketolase [Bradyrhizobium sp. U87765 SZCCT0131]MBR1259329.1 transketolase [Bradyrhizobium sp. U87765 SZCCT0134]MBR1305470.1 transketolase [Bradyrhizobium sp. U87765 SZCCT0110]MBR1321837.1 transketolase [Bradyrhizobium sp. U87765 SZCCT0109]MBR1350885.1 transketolase [Bradyrhizobium sp. U87765 SZCCT0048]
MNNRLVEANFRQARQRLLQMHYDSGVGHIGGNLSAIDAMMITFHEFMQPADRFILSKGHSAGALYTVLWSLGLLTDDDLKTFHRDATLLAGHPPVRGLPQVDFATGSLGHGLSLASGTALAFRLKRTDGHVFCMTSDGEWQEGSTWEAFVFACHHRLSNLTILVDHNGLQGFGNTAEVASMNPLAKRIAGFDADIRIVPGHDADAIRLEMQRRTEGPQVIVLQTVKGKGVSFMENQMEWHYRPLNEALYRQALQELDAA